MRQRRPDTSRMTYFAFDLLFDRDVDLRPLALSERQHDLARLCEKARKAVPRLFLVESFPEGEPLLEWCGTYGLEGIVSKRLSSTYSSGACRSWVKVKSDAWRTANRFRHKLFEGRRREEPDPREREDRANPRAGVPAVRSEEHTSELQSLRHLVCRLLLEKKK